MSQEKIAIFVDVQNIYYTVKEKFNCHFNYQYFWRQVTEGRVVQTAIAYAIDRGDTKQIHFQNILKQIGFEIKLKPFIQRSDGSVKGDWDVGITVDMLEYANSVNSIVLASGDGDYASVIDKVIDRYNVSVELFGVQGLTSNLIIDSATSFQPIRDNFLLNIPQRY